MGVKISEIIPRKKINFEDLANKRVVIDASNMLYQFLSSIRQQDGTPLMDSKGRVTSHLMGTLTRLTNLMDKGVSLCVVFDGKMPLLKVKEQENREYRKNIAAAKVQQALEDQDFEEAYKYSKQTSRLTKEMVEESKKLIEYLGLPVIQAPGEADAQAAFMCKNSDYDKMFNELKVEFDWKEVFDTYKKHDVDKNYILNWKEINIEKVKELLVEEHNFSLERVERLLLQKEAKLKNNSLNKWIK